MPLVTRKITIENENTTFSKETIDHVLYVRPRDVQEGDVEVEPVSNEQLAELAALHPEEYGDMAKAAGVEPATGGRLATLLELPAKKLVEKIGEMTPDADEEILWALYEAEIAEDGEAGDGTGRNRASVIAALAAKGIKD